MQLSSEQLEVLRNVRAVLLDMDGVLYVGNQALPGVQELISYLDDTGRKWLCVTNNSSRTHAMFSEKLAGMNIRVKPENVLGSAAATANWLAQEAPVGAKIMVMGEKSLRDALAEKGFIFVDDPFDAEYAVASIFFDLSYQAVANMTLAIRNGARFIATNPDPTLPTERGQVPGTGSMVALLKAATGVEPEFVGKPYPGMYRLAMQRLGSDVQSTLMVGDRYETDIVGAAKLRMPTAAVLTGVTSKEQFEAANPAPDYILPGLPELLAAFKAADTV